MTSSIDEKQIKSELEFSKSVIDNIFQKKADPVSEASSVKLNDTEKQQMMDLSEAAAQIAGMPTLMLKRKSPVELEGAETPITPDIALQCLNLLDSKEIPSQVVEKVTAIIERMEKYQDFLLRFLKKYS